ncbi:MAG TPA: tripartite tricarboxylate transporter TctB family protein [Paracoccaceae bacterium]|nr:tripartite tricarboxylate transporter TctB family protein [Paracoccaceae bacterium]
MKITALSGEHMQDDPAFQRQRRNWREMVPHLLAPATFLVAMLLLPQAIFEGSVPQARGNGPGPGAWPGTMLHLAAICSAIWLIQEIAAWWRNRPAPVEVPELEAAGEEYGYLKAVLGLGLIIAYGWLLPIIGFTLVTVLFIATWCVLGGIRNPFAVVPVAVLGTIVLLWMFMGAAVMPLPRGIGVFDQFSIATLQMLRIY